MEISKELKQDLAEMESVCGRFLEKYESLLANALNQTEVSAEESLKIDLMLELITHISSAQFVSSYMRKDIVQEGVLEKDENGGLLLNGALIPPMSDIEVFVHDNELQQNVWKRVFVGGPSGNRVCGLKDQDLTIGVRVRIRG